MSIRLARGAANDLARIAFELSPRRARRGWIAWCVLVALALLAGAGASHLYWRERLLQWQRQSVSLGEVQQLRLRFEQVQLQQRVSEGRSHELERQVDGLNQRLRECQEELTFFRRARDARH